MYNDDRRPPNSNECAHNGRKLSNTVAQVKASERIVQVCIGADNDDQFDALVEKSLKEDRVKIGLEIEGGKDWFEIDLEDVLRFAKKYCNGIYERVQSEEGNYKMKTVKCKWCGENTTMLGTRECDRCWELRSRIEGDMVLAEKMMTAIEYGQEKADLLEDDKWAEHFAILKHHQSRL